jgi:hypothetical protein
VTKKKGTSNSCVTNKTLFYSLSSILYIFFSTLSLVMRAAVFLFSTRFFNFSRPACCFSFFARIGALCLRKVKTPQHPTFRTPKKEPSFSHYFFFFFQNSRYLFIFGNKNKRMHPENTFCQKKKIFSQWFCFEIAVFFYFVDQFSENPKTCVTCCFLKPIC